MPVFGELQSSAMSTNFKSITVLAFLLPVLILFTSLLSAHEPQSAPAKPEQIPAATSPHEDHDEEEVASGPARPIPIPFTGNWRRHLHNKIVHFPLALGIVGSLFVFIGLRRPEMMTAARILWFIGAAVGIAAYFSGTWQERPFEHGPMHNIFELHENLGIVSVVSMWVGFFLTFVKRLKGLTALVAIEIAAVIACTGFYGGLLAH
jgi:uncharacterized membrane protein